MDLGNCTRHCSDKDLLLGDGGVSPDPVVNLETARAYRLVLMDSWFFCDMFLIYFTLCYFFVTFPSLPSH